MLDTPLASPLHLRSGAVLPNRLAKAAMSEVLGDVTTGAPTEQMIRLYERWGRSGAGLLITGNVIVDPDGMGEPGNVVVTDDRHLPELRRWAQAAQAHGAKLWMQINHTGRQSPKKLTRQPVAPSPVAMKRGFSSVFAPPRALADAEIHAIIGRFAATAAIAQRAGFAGVELHGAHGYLISQFLSPHTNRRTDDWGGDAERRSRFLLEIVRAVRAAVGPAFPIGVKLNSADFQRGGFTIEEALAVARALEAAGIDLLEISGGSYEMPAMAGAAQSTRDREAYFLDYAERIRAVTKLPLMLTGGLRSRAAMERALVAGIDVIGLGRPMTHAPELPGQLLDGTVAASPTVNPRTRIRLLDNILQVAWFQLQIRELGAGREPDAKLGAWTALWRSRGSFFGKPVRLDRGIAVRAAA